MSATKLHTKEELKKLSLKDRVELNHSLEKDLAEVRIDLRTGKAKQGHKVKAIKKQIARIQTFNNQAQDEK